MTTTIWLRDIGALVLQLALVIGTGAALSRLFRLADPRATLNYWRVLLVASLLLPVYQPRRVVSVPVVVATTAATATTAQRDFADAPRTAVRSRSWAAGDVVLVVLAAGVVGRGLWLLIGALALARLRRTARRLDPIPAPMREAFDRIGGRTELYLSDRISGPVTFGFRRPVVLLPTSALTLAPHVQEAIAYHELVHVQRHDWIHEVVEEIVRTGLWFHPAVWWLIGRIRLAREQVVDRAAIALTHSRDRYVEALLAVAITQSPVALAPAPLFLRRSLLKQRVMHILQETTMTTRRLIASLTVSAATLSLAAFGAIRAFPLEARAQMQTAASNAPVQIALGGEHLLHGSIPEYPHRAAAQKIEGDVMLDLTLNDRGEVSDARVVSGPDELRRAALESVLNWHYSPADLRNVSKEVTLSFHLPPEGLANKEAYEKELNVRRKMTALSYIKNDAESAERAEHIVKEVQAALADPNITPEQREKAEHLGQEAKQMLEKARAEKEGAQNPFDKNPTLVRIKTERVSSEVMQEILAHAGVRIGDPVSAVSAKKIREAADSVDEHLRVEFGGDGKGGLVLVVLAP